MSISRKCPKCQTWNDELDYCKNCGELLNYQIRRKIEVEKQEEDFKNRELDRMERALEGLKQSPYIFMRGLYHVFHAVWFLFIIITSFIMSLIVAAAG